MESSFRYGNTDPDRGTAFRSDFNGQPQPQASTTGAQDSNPQLRTCRICLDSTTQLEDPELGRLISPCKCKGSSRYVHQECLNQWRLHSANDTNYYQCPTCKFQYRLQRLTWAHFINSSLAQIVITIGIFIVVVFVLGFISEQAINTYLDFYGYFSAYPTVRIYSTPTSDPFERRFQAQERSRFGGFVEHMLRGLTSLGFLGFIKVSFVSWIRPHYIARPGNGGRERLSQLAWIIVLVGVFNFFRWTWGWVRGKTKGFLDGVAEGVLDIPQEDDNEKRD